MWAICRKSVQLQNLLFWWDISRPFEIMPNRSRVRTALGGETIPMHDDPPRKWGIQHTSHILLFIQLLQIFQSLTLKQGYNCMAQTMIHTYSYTTSNTYFAISSGSSHFFDLHSTSCPMTLIKKTKHISNQHFTRLNKMFACLYVKIIEPFVIIWEYYVVIWEF